MDIFDNLVYRYEEPNGMTRWDSPLFTVPYDDEKPPFDDIWEVLVGSEGKAKTVKPNQATVTVCEHREQTLAFPNQTCRKRPQNRIICMNLTK